MLDPTANPQQISVNLGQIMEWLKFAGYLVGVVTVTWRLSSFATSALNDARSFAADIRIFMEETRTHMKDVSRLGELVVSNHLTHIEHSLQKLADAPTVRLVDEETKS